MPPFPLRKINLTPSKLARTSLVLTFILVGSVSCDSATNPPNLTPTLSAGQIEDATAGAMGLSTSLARLTQASAATGTAEVVQSTQVVQTAEAGTATVEAQTAGTATVVAKATAQAVLDAKFGWPTLIKESFTDNQLGWPIGLKQDHSLAVTSTLADGTYQWTSTVTNGNSYFNLIPTNGPVLTNFYALVTVKFTAGNDDGQSAYGLTFRQVGDDYGFFGILKSGGFRALEVHHTGIYQSEVGTSAAINTAPGQTNRIGVVGIGPNYVFLVNDKPVAQLNADFEPGQLGLGIDAGSKASEAQIEFSDFEVRKP
jgi:hypothetical protein